MQAFGEEFKAGLGFQIGHNQQKCWRTSNLYFLANPSAVDPVIEARCASLLVWDCPPITAKPFKPGGEAAKCGLSRPPMMCRQLITATWWTDAVAV